MQNGFPVELRFVLCCLATWRLTHLVVMEDGPWDAVVRVRAWFGESVVGQAMDCFYCTSFWIALPFAFLAGHDAVNILLSWLAISGAASLLEQATNREMNAEQSPRDSGDGRRRE